MNALKEYCGRYEFSNLRHGGPNHKFWEIRHDPASGMYIATWGKIGGAPQGRKEYAFVEAQKKINEKIAKGYKLKNNPAMSSLEKQKEKNREKMIGRSLDAIKKANEPKKTGTDDAFDFMKELKKL